MKFQNSLEIQNQYKKVRKKTVELCELLSEEDYIIQPIEDVSPIKWHLGHTTWFIELFILSEYIESYKPFDRNFNFLFNSYYETVGERIIKAKRGNIVKPSVADIYKYRDHVDENMNRLFNNLSNLPVDVYNVIEIAWHHEQQHQELLITDLKYVYGHNILFPSYFNEEQLNYEDYNINDNSFLKIDEGVYEIGHKDNEFCFDNELGLHKVFLPAFQFQDRLITNREYLEFVKDGGYTNYIYWLSDGWTWVKNKNIKSPLYWYKIENDWYYYTLHGLRELDLNASVSHVSFYEADAFASWKNKRLLTEFEWEIAFLKYGKKQKIFNFQDNNLFMPIPRKDKSLQMYGDVWEWTNSAYLPYPNYKKSKGALGEYNGKFMVNQMVLRGGSCVTPADHIRPTYRNYFQPDKRWQYTGIRLAEYI